MLLQLLTLDKRLTQTLHDLLLFHRQLIWALFFHSRKIHILHVIFLPVDRYRLFLIIDMIQKQPVVHVKFRPAHDQLSFQLELKNGDRLVHFHIQTQILRIVLGIIFDGKSIAVRVFIDFYRKSGKRYQIDAITLFQRIEISIPCRHSDNIGNAGEMSARSPHPYDIVIAPLYIDRMIVHQRIHNNIWSRSPVINIPDDMQMIDNQVLYQVAERRNKFRCPADPDDRMDDFIIISFFILNFRLRNLYKTVQRDLIPVLNAALILFPQDDIQFFLRIIDQRCKSFFILIAKGISKFFINLPAHGTGTVLQHMVKLLIFAVNIRDKMLRSFWQAQNRLQINDLRRSRRDRRILLRQTFQISLFQFVHLLPSLSILISIYPLEECPSFRAFFRVRKVRTANRRSSWRSALWRKP